MCGIAGFCDYTRKLRREDLARMADALVHRGPDDSGCGIWTNGRANVGLAHRRLSIIDLSSQGHQPMVDQTGDFVITYNGEVYNYKEIRKELEGAGVQFVSDSDTEVILNSFMKWGAEAVGRFIGMFAFAVYAIKEDKLYLFRDRTGVKPLFYMWDGKTLAFGSELKTFNGFPGFEKTVNFNAVDSYLRYGYIPAPATIFENVYKLKAGHYLEFDASTRMIKEIEYWSASDYYNKPKLSLTEDEAIEELEGIISSAFRYRLVSDVPVGLFLSGGYDSGAVAALLAKDLGSSLKTFTIGFRESAYDEAPYAREVARHLGTDHSEIYCSHQEAFDLIPLLPAVYDEPFGDSSAIPTILVSRFARRHVKVALSADGGDELFAGYTVYKRAYDAFNAVMKIPPGLLGPINSLTRLVDPSILARVVRIYNLEGKYFKLQEMLQRVTPVDYLNIFSKYFFDQESRQILNRDIRQDQLLDATKIDPQDSHIQAMLYASYVCYLPDDILQKVDRATMSVGLEGREPLLDHRIIEFVAQLPFHFKQQGDQTKYLLKKIVHKYLPESLMNRKKSGFSIPVGEWLKGPLRDYVYFYLSDDNIKKTAVFDHGVVKGIRDNFFRGSGNPHKVWLLMNYQMWHEKWA